VLLIAGPLVDRMYPDWPVMPFVEPGLPSRTER
jgi:hypothetical protein